MLIFHDSLQCVDCYSEYKYSRFFKFFEFIIISLSLWLAVFLGLLTESIFFFGLLLLVSPFAIDFVLARFLPLRKTGFKAMMEKIKDVSQ